MDSMDQMVAVSLDKSQLDSGLKSFCENNIGETIALIKPSGNENAAHVLTFSLSYQVKQALYLIVRSQCKI